MHIDLQWGVSHCGVGEESSLLGCAVHTGPAVQEASWTAGP